MKYQTRSYTCGPAAVVNALRLYGVEVAELHVSKLAGTTPEEGTDDRRMMKALRSLGCKPSVVALTSTIRKRLARGVPVIIHIDEEEHWVTLLGTLGESFIAFDSWKSKDNLRENGVRVITPGKHCFAICVNKPLTAV